MTKKSANEENQTKWNLPADVIYCKKCVISNQRPRSSVEFRHGRNHAHSTMQFDEEGICQACRYAEMKEREIDWKKRETELAKLCDQYRSKDGSYDVLVPGSGGKDSAMAAHILKYRYGMHPLTCTWPPHIYTDIGWKNFRNWIDVGGFDNMTLSPNGRVHRLLTRLGFENILHPFQTFILGQKNFAPQLAIKYGIPLVFYGENEAEYGNKITDNFTPKRDKQYHTKLALEDMSLGGVPVPELMEKHGLTLHDLEPYLPPDGEALEKAGVNVQYLGYYIKWTPQECYYYAAEHCGFQANPERTEGTYTKFVSLDDRIDGLNFFTIFIKFGIGRATYDAVRDIRNNHLTREEAVALVKKFDGEFPKKYFKEILEYMDISEERFWEHIDKARSPHLWSKEGGNWKLKHQVSDLEKTNAGVL